MSDLTQRSPASVDPENTGSSRSRIGSPLAAMEPASADYSLFKVSTSSVHFQRELKKIRFMSLRRRHKRRRLRDWKEIVSATRSPT